VLGDEQAHDCAFREAEQADAVLIDFGVFARRIGDPGEHARAVFPFDAAFVVTGDCDVSPRRERARMPSKWLECSPRLSL
jgi:hypothetical protein